ncbi:MAG: hypothetical protein GEU99_02965 [Luteitalea sp.]|nr:hypothetical protein [Luteitalea sp.]
MLIRIALALLSIVIVPESPTVPDQGVPYYVDCAAGDDASDGLSPAHPWKSLKRVSNHPFDPGDSIHFKRGTVCRGMLWPKGSGTDGSPIRVSSYGTGPLLRIQSGPQHVAAFRLFNQEYWHVESMEFVGGEPHGVWISGDKGVLHQIHLKNIVVRDVTGEVGKQKESGLIIVSPGTPEQRFDGVVIDGATAYKTTQWAGILVGGGDFGFPPESTRSTNVVVRNSIVHDVQGDGIVLFRVNHGLIEKSVAWHTGMQFKETIGTPNGIWTWMCRDCTVQYNEAFLTDSPGIDGGAFDIDYGNADNVVQYNYGHDTQGYCVAVFGASWVTTNSVVRDNVCVNNGVSPRLARHQGAILLSTWDDGKLDGVQIESNTVVWGPAVDAPAVKNSADFVGRPGIFRDNLIRSTSQAWIANNGSLRLEGNTFEHIDAVDAMEDPKRESHADRSSVPVLNLPVSLARYAGKWLLLSHIDTGAPSRSQVVMLQSVQQQFRARGLQVVLRGPVARDVAYDWHLQDIPLLPNDGHEPAGQRPTTLLVSPDRTVVARWEGFVPPAVVGMALRQHLGAPDFAQMGRER